MPIDQYEKLDDLSLWSKIAQGDMMAFSVTYKRHYSSLYHYGLKCINSTPLVEDSIQDLFIKLWDRKHAIKIKTSFKAYLFTMFRRIVVEKIEQAQKKSSLDHPSDKELYSISIQELIIKTEVQEETLHKLAESLKSLAPRQREILYLRFYENMSYQQISETLDLKNQSVRNSIYESIKTLKSIIKVIVLIIISHL